MPDGARGVSARSSDEVEEEIPRSKGPLSFWLACVRPPSLSHSLSVLGFIAVLIFGVGAWAGMAYANRYAHDSYLLSLWTTCHDHEVG